MSIDPNLIPILILTLILWAGVFVYLLRVDTLVRRTQRELKEKLKNIKIEKK